MPLVQPETIGNSFARIEYNGFTFPSYITARITADPVPTASGRAVRHLKFNLSVETVITYATFAETDAGGETYIGETNADLVDVNPAIAGDRLDPAMLRVFQKLLARGKKLKIIGLGLGGIEINPQETSATRNKDPNVSATLVDLDNGPVPRMGAINWMRAARAVLFTWECSFTISSCIENTVIDKFDPTVDGLDYSVGYSVNENGMMTRTISGTVTIPNWVRDGHTAVNIDSVGKLGSVRDRLAQSFALPINCQRTQNFNTNESRTQLSFTLTDTEIPSENAYMAGTIRMNVSQTVSNNTDATAAEEDDDLKWGVNFTGTVEVAPHYPKSLAWFAIVAVLSERLSVQKTMADTYYQTKLSITEEIFGRTVSFSFSYSAVFPIARMFEISRLFTPITGTTWKGWNEARLPIMKPYGYQGTQMFRPNDVSDYVVTICDGVHTAPAPERTANDEPPKPQDKPISKNEEVSKALATNVSEESSFRFWKNRVLLTSSYNVVTPSVIGPGDAAQIPNPTNVPQSARNNLMRKDELHIVRTNPTANPSQSASTTGSGAIAITPNTIQVRGTGQHYIHLVGRAERVRYPIDIPEYSAVGPDVPTPILVEEKIMPSQVLCYTSDGVPVYVAEWNRVYCLPDLQNRIVKLSSVPVQFFTPDSINYRSGESLA